MLIKAKTIKGYKLHALDGEIGTVEEFYFDDQNWSIRYLIAETGDWLADRQVLISPHSLGAINNQDRSISINLMKKQIEDSPPLENDKPVSLQFEETYYGYYGYPMYWGDSYLWGSSANIAQSKMDEELAQKKKKWNPNLRSTRAVNGYNIRAEDGRIGHVDDFIIDDETWTIRYLVIDTRNWLPGKKVLISPKWIDEISWSEMMVYVNLLRETIKMSPEYTEESLLTRDYESGLHQHYNRQGYWADEPKAK